MTRTGEVDDAPDQGGAEELAVHAPIHLTRSSAPSTSTGSPASPVEVQERHCPAAAEGRTRCRTMHSVDVDVRITAPAAVAPSRAQVNALARDPRLLGAP